MACVSPQALEVTENSQQVTHIFKFLERDGAAELLEKSWLDQLEASSWPISASGEKRKTIKISNPMKDVQEDDQDAHIGFSEGGDGSTGQAGGCCNIS